MFWPEGAEVLLNVVLPTEHDSPSSLWAGNECMRGGSTPLAGVCVCLKGGPDPR